MQCERCGGDVARMRVAALQEMGRPITCLVCSDAVEPVRRVFMDITHKTGSEAVIVEGDENIRRAAAINRRRR